jgi:hypothetical protein
LQHSEQASIVEITFGFWREMPQLLRSCCPLAESRHEGSSLLDHFRMSALAGFRPGGLT